MILMILLGAVCYHHEQSNSLVLTVRADYVPCLTVSTQQSDNTIEIWQDETSGRNFFFLPSCVTRHTVTVGNIGTDSLRIDGKLLEKGDTFSWEEEQAYELQITDEAYETHTYSVVFMKSANIPAVFIDTASGSMAYLNEDKKHEETGDIRVVDKNGNTEYQGALERISGRGNSTWKYDKKPYAIKLTEKYPLCGLKKGDKWRLLSLCREGSKLDNKIAMDLAEELGIAYSPQGTWVDLYLNGEYAGNYLLAESVSVGEGRVEISDLEKENKKYNENIDTADTYAEEDNKGYLIENGRDISGGYLIERDFELYYEEEKAGFVTSVGNRFTVRAPQHASREQVLYIQDCVENVEQMVQSEQAEVWDYLDADSFVKRFMIDEIALNMDVGITSMYFYKERGDDKLYSGPAWDYDNAFGDGESYLHYNYNYERTVLKDCDQDENRLNWYVKLYETPEVQERLRQEYAGILPFCEDLLNYKIDEYVRTISASAAMDRLRWLSGIEEAEGEWVMSSGRYSFFDDNVKYTKFFLAKRLNWLCERWGVEHELFQTPSNGQMHTVTFLNDEGVVAVEEVMDGEELEKPEYDEDVYCGWRNQESGEEYIQQMPVYEDAVYYNARLE